MPPISASAAQPDQPPVAPPRPEAERALPPGEAAEQRGRDQPAQEHRLEQRHVAGDALDEGVVAGEARPCRRPCTRRRGGSRQAGLQRSWRPASRITSSVETTPSAELASMIASSGHAPVPGPSTAPATTDSKRAAADHQRAAETRGGAGEVRPHRDDPGIGARQQEAVAEPDEEDRAEEGERRRPPRRGRTPIASRIPAVATIPPASIMRLIPTRARVAPREEVADHVADRDEAEMEPELRRAHAEHLARHPRPAAEEGEEGPRGQRRRRRIAPEPPRAEELGIGAQLRGEARRRRQVGLAEVGPDQRQRDRGRTRG